MSCDTDVLVVGGGPAGLAAAIAARKKGFEVTVADGSKPPIDKACGEGLMPDALRGLHDLGVIIAPEEGLAFRGICFLDAAAVEGIFPSCNGLGMRRTVLHEKMIARAEACGVALLWNTPVTGVTADGALIGGRKMTARWIVGADGLSSRVRGWAGLESGTAQKPRYARTRHYRLKPWTDFVEVYWGKEVQAYVTPLGSEEVCVAVISADPRMHLDHARKEIPGLASRLVDAETMNAGRGAITVTRTLNKVYKGNIVLTGDASGSIDAITGEGLCQSFRQALALADALVSENLESYQATHRRLAQRPNLISRLLLMLSQHSFARRRVLRTLAKNPDLFSRLLAMHVGETSALHSVTTSALLGWKLLAA